MKKTRIRVVRMCLMQKCRQRVMAKGVKNMKDIYLKNIFLISVYDYAVFIFMLVGMLLGVVFQLESFLLFLIPVCSMLCILIYIGLMVFSVFKIVKLIISSEINKKIIIAFKIIILDIAAALPSCLIIIAAMTLAVQ